VYTEIAIFIIIIIIIINESQFESDKEEGRGDIISGFIDGIHSGELDLYVNMFTMCFYVYICTCVPIYVDI
jgi:hypothetical protein